MAVIAKFKVIETKQTPGQRVVLGEDGKPKKNERGYDVYEDIEMQSVKMTPVYGNGDPLHENTKFWQSSPSGSLELNVVNPDAGKQFKLHQEWYLTFELAK